MCLSNNTTFIICLFDDYIQTSIIVRILDITMNNSNNTKKIIHTYVDANNNTISESIEYIEEETITRKKVKDDFDDIFAILYKEADNAQKALQFISEKDAQSFCEFIEQLYPKDELSLDHNSKLISLLHFLTKLFESAPKEERPTLVDFILDNKIVSPKNCLLMAVVTQDHDVKYSLWEKGIKTDEKHYDHFYDLIGSRLHSYPKQEHINQKGTFFIEQDTYILRFELQRELTNANPKRAQKKI